MQITLSPAPWRVEKVNFASWVIYPRGDNLVGLARCHREADAQLIAAAPDMLTVLKEIYLPLLEGTFYDDHDRATEMVGKIRKVIAKAEPQ